MVVETMPTEEMTTKTRTDTWLASKSLKAWTTDINININSGLRDSELSGVLCPFS